jgi:hypothetical protein
VRPWGEPYSEEFKGRPDRRRPENETRSHRGEPQSENRWSICVASVLLMIPAGVAYGRATRPNLSPRRDYPCPSQVYTSHPIAHDGQTYGLRSGGEGPLNASGSYGAMLEARNPVGSSGF